MLAADISLNQDAQAYELQLAGQLACKAEFSTTGQVRDFHHTEAMPEFRGQGLAGRLIKYALDDTIAAGYLIQPTCSAVAHFISKHPEYEDHLVSENN